MASLKYLDLLPHVLPEVTGCSDIMAEHAIRDSVIALCAASRIWKYLCDGAPVTAGTAECSVDIPSDAALVTILSASTQGNSLIPVSTDQLTAMYGAWRTETGDPRYYTQVAPEELVLVPIPDSALTVDVFAALQPGRKTTSFPAWINDRYQDTIVAGAKARLMRQRGQPWFNPQLAAVYQADFDQGAAVASHAGQQSLVRASGRTTSQH